MQRPASRNALSCLLASHANGQVTFYCLSDMQNLPPRESFPDMLNRKEQFGYIWQDWVYDQAYEKSIHMDANPGPTCKAAAFAPPPDPGSR